MLFIGVNTGLHAKHYTLIYYQLSVFSQSQFAAVHRSRGRPFEIVAGLVVPTPVAGTFVFVLGGKPARCATEMGTFGKDGVEPDGFTHDPYAELSLVLLANLSDRIVRRKTRLECRRRHE